MRNRTSLKYLLLYIIIIVSLYFVLLPNMILFKDTIHSQMDLAELVKDNATKTNIGQHVTYISPYKSNSMTFGKHDSEKNKSWRKREEKWSSLFEFINESTLLDDDFNFCRKVEPWTGPFNYSEEFKNPCWWEDDPRGAWQKRAGHNARRKLRCLSYFYIAGFSKCGTTDLDQRLSKHPQIKDTGKEKHWFDYKRYTNLGEDFNHTYVDMHNRLSIMLSKTETTDVAKRRMVTADNTPCYIWSSHYWRCYEGNQGLAEPRYTNADLIYRMNPAAKIIVIMRDPVSRLLSRHNHDIRSDPQHAIHHVAYTDPSAVTFHGICSDAVDMYRDCFSQHSVRRCAYDGELYGKAKLRLQEGMYSVYIKDWLKVFPRNQLLFLRFEDYVKDITYSLNTVVSFLDLEPFTETQLTEAMNREVANKFDSPNTISAMLNTTSDMLRKFYSPFVAELQTLLGDQFTWGY